MKKSIKKLFFATVLAACTVVEPVAFAQTPVTTTDSAEHTDDLMAVFEEADMALRTLGGALDRYNGGSELNCGEFMMYADILANVKVPEVSGIWVDLHAIYVKAANHATTAIEGVVSTCSNNGMGMLKPGSINQLTFGVARMGINEAIEMLNPALLVAAEQPDAPELEGDMPEGDMPEGDMPEDGTCVIPASGPWPACATGADAKPDVPANCVVPESGPWPECAKTAPQKKSGKKVVKNSDLPAEIEVIETPTTDYQITASGWTMTIPGGYEYEEGDGAIIIIGESVTEFTLATIVPVALDDKAAETLEELISLGLSKDFYDEQLKEATKDFLEELEIDEADTSITYSDMVIGTGETGRKSTLKIMEEGESIFVVVGIVYNRQTQSLVSISSVYTPESAGAKVALITSTLKPAQ